MQTGPGQAGIIRNAIPADISSIIAIERNATGSAHWAERAYREALDPGAAERVLLVFDLQGIIRGFLVARFGVAECELENIVVSNEYRRAGIGSSLIRKLVSTCQARRLGRILLEVRESNSAARFMYTRLGFKESGRRKSYYPDPPEDAILYMLTL